MPFCARRPESLIALRFSREQVTVAPNVFSSSSIHVGQVDKKGRVKDRSWKSVQKMMTDPGKFLLTLKAAIGDSRQD